MLIPIESTSRERCLKLFQTLNEAGILWCSWKSNRHFEAGLDAETDLDLLFMPQDKARVTRIMLSCGFLMFKPAKHRAYPGVADYISFEMATGKVLHIHAHFLLTLGEKNAKSFIFPWNDLILARRTPIPGVEEGQASDPADELVFLLVRDAVKIRWRDNARSSQEGKPYGSKGFVEEYDWLKEKVDLESFSKAAASMFEGEILTLLMSAYTKPDMENMRNLKGAANQYGYKNGWKRFTPAQTALTMLTNESLNYFCRIFEKLGWEQSLVPRRRLLPGQGLVVAFLGADGSGKSTVTKRVQSDWQHKLDVPLFYMGIGDGQSHIAVELAKLILFCGRKLRSLLKKKNAEKNPPGEKQQTYRPNPVLALAGALAKKSLIKKIKRLRNKGYVVICDRWPQASHPGMNDGPILHESLNDPSPLLRLISKWESHQYEAMQRILKPDLCLKLIASLEVALDRKPENEAVKEIIADKIKIIKELEIASGHKDVIINADQSLEDVLKQVRSELFRYMIEHGRAKKPFYRECVGLPGSGKTTLTDHLTASGSYAPFSEHYAKMFPNRAARLKALTLSLLFDFVLYLKILGFATRYNLWKSPNVWHLLKSPMRRRALLCWPENSAYISEQLFLQEIWTILIDIKNENEVQPQHLAPIIKGLYEGVNTQILYFIAPATLAAQRIETRPNGKSRFDGKPAQEIQPLLAQTQPQMSGLVKACRFAGLDIIEIDSSGPVEQIAANLVALDE